MTDEIKILTEDDSDAWAAQLQLEESYQKVTPKRETLHLPLVKEIAPRSKLDKNLNSSNLCMEISNRHGSAEDRGSADSYYRRPFTPHYYVGDSYNSSRIKLKPTDPEYKLYEKGYREQVDHKDWR